MLFSIIGVIKNKSGVSLFELTGTYVRYGLFHCFYMQGKKPKKPCKMESQNIATHAKALLRFTNI